MIVIFFNQKDLSLTYREGFQALSRRIFSYFDEGKSSVIAREARARSPDFDWRAGECNFCYST